MWSCWTSGVVKFMVKYGRILSSTVANIVLEIVHLCNAISLVIKEGGGRVQYRWSVKDRQSNFFFYGKK